MCSVRIEIRAELQSCQYIPAQRINVKSPDPLAYLIDSVPNLDELLKPETSTEANLDLLKKVKIDFIYCNRKEKFKPALNDKF